MKDRCLVLIHLAIHIFASDVTRPVISLDINQNSDIQAYHTTKAGIPCNGFRGTARADHELCRSRAGQAYGSSTLSSGVNTKREDFSKECVAKAANSNNCNAPVAKAYDHHDGKLTVSTTLYLVNNNGLQSLETHVAINYDLRSEWLMTFDAVDKSGNMAEQLVFAMILNDPIAPTIATALHFPMTLESCDPNQPRFDKLQPSLWHIPLKDASAVDNYDGDVSSSMNLIIVGPTNRIQEYTWSDRLQEPTIDTFLLGEWSLTYGARDTAGMFGATGHDNEATVLGSVLVVDTRPPIIHCKKQTCAFDDVGATRDSRSLTLISTAPAADAEACCGLCNRLSWYDLQGAAGAASASCSYFTFVTPSNRCELYTANTHATYPLTLAPSGVISGSPIAVRAPPLSHHHYIH
jgi:hypothetical protein